jgi:hypothetical protein
MECVESRDLKLVFIPGNGLMLRVAESITGSSVSVRYVKPEIFPRVNEAADISLNPVHDAAFDGVACRS